MSIVESDQAVAAVPADLIVVGHVTDAWGLRGGIKITPYSPDAGALLSVKHWWVQQGADDATPVSQEVFAAKAHGDHITAQLVGMVDRTAAEKMKGARVSIPRSRFPTLDEGEYYWIDLIGLDVVNTAGEALGQVAGLMDNGAHQILEVHQLVADGKPLERLIPFVGDYVETIDLPTKRVTVNWGLDY